MPTPTITFVISARLSARNNSPSARRILTKFDVNILRKSVENIFIKIRQEKRVLHEDLRKFFIIFCSVLHKIRNASDRSWWQNQDTSYRSNIKSKNNVQTNRPQETTWRMHIEFWIPKAKNTHSEFVFAFQVQQWLHERASMLRYTNVACVVCPIMFLYEYHCYRMANSAFWEYKWTKTCWTRAIRVIRV